MALNESGSTRPPYVRFGEVLGRIPPEKRQERSGLDLHDTLLWYKTNKDFLKVVVGERLTNVVPVDISDNEGLQRTQVSAQFLGKLTGLFPETARQRTILTKIFGETPLFFHKSSLEKGPNPTPDPEQAISPTAIIPGYTEYKREDDGRLDAKMHLYQIPNTSISSDIEVSRLILAEAYVHEYFHTITADLLYSKGRYLKLPDGRIIDAFSFVVDVFGSLAENHDPISHYSSTYKDGHKFTGEGPKRTASIHEEFAETGTTHLLGFASGSLTDISGEALADRPEMAFVFDDFLHADVLTQKEVDSGEFAMVDADTLISEYQSKPIRAGEA